MTAFAQTTVQLELPVDLARILTDYERAWNTNDSAALAQLFAEDGMILPAGGLMVRGRKAIERAYSRPGKRPLSLRAVAFATEGSTGYIIGAFSEPGAPDRGKFTLTLRRESSGRWLIVSDMDNGNRAQVSSRCKP